MGNQVSVSTSVRQRVRVLCTLAVALTFIRYSALHHPLSYPQLGALNERMKRYQPFHLILLTLTSCYALSHLSLLLGLNAPIPSLSTEPDMNYSPTFSNARYFLSSDPPPHPHAAEHTLCTPHLLCSAAVVTNLTPFPSLPYQPPGTPPSSPLPMSPSLPCATSSPLSSVCSTSPNPTAPSARCTCSAPA